MRKILFILLIVIFLSPFTLASYKGKYHSKKEYYKKLRENNKEYYKSLRNYNRYRHKNKKTQYNRNKYYQNTYRNFNRKRQYRDEKLYPRNHGHYSYIHRGRVVYGPIRSWRNNYKRGYQKTYRYTRKRRCRKSIYR